MIIGTVLLVVGLWLALAALGIDDPFELTGVYEGVPVGEKHSAPSGTLPDRIRLIDFKTARRPPESLDAVPVSILRQMAAYAAALEAAYPGRTVEAALLYTQAPRLIALPDELLAVHKQALLAAQESF